CSRSCGAGVQSAERQCSSPTPKYGGRYCLGERKRFRICNVRPCPPDKPSFRQVQCSQFNPMLYKGKLYKWTPVPNNINPCELHCRPEDEYFAEKLRDAVIDGTPCYEMNASRDMCINGICKTVAIGYVDIGIIPVGAREIRIEEVAEAGNFLALRSEDPEKYFLNGGWTIQWNGDYRVAGTTFTYKRTGNWENLTSPGPTVEPVWIQLLFQETNPGVRYQYTIQRPADSENEIEQPEFFWRFGSWTTCTATCGTGVQRQIVHCVEKLAGIVEERYCDALTRPDDQQRTCSEDPCPHRSKPDATAPCHREVPCPSQWAVGDWSECSVTCGNGTQRRPVYCSNSTGIACDPAERPSSETICSSPQCQKSDNANTDWSGSGSSSREIFNEIHYIPSNHIAKFNPIIPDVPESNDVNIITEEDFSAKKGNVFVDDFYYDYNFINFHEDLSYYPFTEKETKGEGQKPGLSTNDVEGSREMPADVLHTAKPGGGESQDHLPREANASASVHGEGETEPGDLATNDLLSVIPKGVRTAAPHYAIPDFTANPSPATDTSDSPGELGSSSEVHMNTEGPSSTSSEEHNLASSAGTRHKDSREMDLVITSDADDAAPETREQEGWAEVTEGTADNEQEEEEMEKEEALLPPSTTAMPSWEVGNWSECSVTCGVGAIWRTVRCSTNRDNDCAAANRPVPARRCSLRPCSSWRVGNWSKCSRSCGGGMKVRDVHCVDTRDQRLLRPFHCHTVLYKPPAQLPCRDTPCLDWYTSSWRELPLPKTKFQGEIVSSAKIFRPEVDPVRIHAETLHRIEARSGKKR
ncbi:PREDICTED: A disintegrin and metalloproteinase with thrombospondin motifs 7-like, partial [Apaloderma vittatum]|uniref:A disintegrin and metalloproteinase with thrombospondin motifs 7-like n=1 Tax=Apaloderma vittatum TaxID=57397 RepID=UPI000521288B